jgi:hypothetical protein
MGHVLTVADDRLHIRYHLELFWGVARSPLYAELKVKIPYLPTYLPNPRTLEIGDKESAFTIISLPDGVTFPHGVDRLLVTPIYETFWNLVTDDEDWQVQLGALEPFSYLSHSTIIEGQPGIGKFLVPFTFIRLQCSSFHLTNGKDHLPELFASSSTSEAAGHDFLRSQRLCLRFWWQRCAKGGSREKISHHGIGYKPPLLCSGQPRRRFGTS